VKVLFTHAKAGMDTSAMTSEWDLMTLQEKFGNRFKANAHLGKFTAAQIGGAADGLLVVDSIVALIEAVTYLWEVEVPFFILGGGSNILISDAGVRGLVILNRARQVEFDVDADPPNVRADSGANFGLVARQAAGRGLAGLEWAAGIPGTVGGAVVGNAGAHGNDMASSLLLADILHRENVNNLIEYGSQPEVMYRRENWTVERLKFGYRSSVLKSDPALESRMGVPSHFPHQPDSIVLGALLHLSKSSPDAAAVKLDEFVEFRRRTQPPGASMGSMFKNPPRDFAGRLIDAAGLKGKRIGGAGISPLHGNFFINYGGASAADVWELICLARQAVSERFGVTLELEIQLVGDWDGGLSI
jgi:UDP-N-acetylmuramate dehydrogenase